MVRDPIRWLYSLQQFGIKLGLDNIRALLDRLGHPESAFSSVLVGGTNGKGSVAAMLDAMLAASGVRTGLYTSPHLIRPGERIRIAGSDIQPGHLDRHLEAVREACERAVADQGLAAHPSFFEVMTATALHAFREAGVRVAVLEVGLGGRLDATNAVEAVLSIVVTVDLDHTERLGRSLEQIAAEKAGIVKKGKPLVSGVAQGEARAVLASACREAGSPFIEASQIASLTEGTEGAFTVRTARARYEDLRTPLPGRHQMGNARVALVAFEEVSRALGLTAASGDVKRGLASVRWAGRLQWIPGTPPLLLDGAHNPAGAAVLAEYLRGRGGHRPVLLFGAMRDKDVSHMLSPLAGLVEAVILTRAPVQHAADPHELTQQVPEGMGPAAVCPDPGAALERARALAGPGGWVLVAGSLYLVGDILGRLESRHVPGPVPL